MCTLVDVYTSRCIHSLYTLVGVYVYMYTPAKASVGGEGGGLFFYSYLRKFARVVMVADLQ